MAGDENYDGKSWGSDTIPDSYRDHVPTWNFLVFAFWTAGVMGENWDGKRSCLCRINVRVKAIRLSCNMPQSPKRSPPHRIPTPAPLAMRSGRRPGRIANFPHCSLLM